MPGIIELLEQILGGGQQSNRLADPWLHGDGWRVGPLTLTETSRRNADKRWNEIQAAQRAATVESNPRTMDRWYPTLPEDRRAIDRSKGNKSTPKSDRLRDPASARVDQAFSTVAGGPEGGLSFDQALAYAKSVRPGPQLPQEAPTPAGRPADGNPVQAASAAPQQRGPAGDPYLAWQRGLGSEGGSMPGAPMAGGGGRASLVGSSGPDRLESQPAGQGGGVGGFLQGLFGQGGGAQQKLAAQWLAKQGMDKGMAAVVAGNPDLLKAVVGKSVSGGGADWQMQTIYDEKGNEQRVLMDMNNPSSFKPIGGAKTNLKTPEEVAQAKEIAAAGKTDIKLPTLENEYDKTLGKSYGDRFTEIQKEAQTAQRALNSLSVMEQVMGNEGFYSGAAADQVKRVKQFGVALGFDASGVQDMETFNAMSKQAALDVMGGSLGTGFSNADRDFVIDQVPNLGNTPEGNRQLIQIQRKLAQRKQQIAQLARDYAERNGGRIDPGFDDYLAQWAEANQLFAQAPDNAPADGGGEEVSNMPPPDGIAPEVWKHVPAEKRKLWMQ